MTLKDDLKNTADKLRNQRDELKLQMHFANMEVLDDWESLERQWQEFIARSKQVQKEIETDTEKICTALLILGDEIKTGYKKIKTTLK